MRLYVDTKELSICFSLLFLFNHLVVLCYSYYLEELDLSSCLLNNDTLQMLCPAFRHTYNLKWDLKLNIWSCCLQKKATRDHDAWCILHDGDGTIIATRTAFILCWMLQWSDALTHYNQASDSEKHAAKKFEIFDPLQPSSPQGALPVWYCFSSKGTGWVDCIEGTIDGVINCKILTLFRQLEDENGLWMGPALHWPIHIPNTYQHYTYHQWAGVAKVQTLCT